MPAVNTEQRRLLEKVVGLARDAAEAAADAALKRLAVDQDGGAFPTMTADERALRNLLRAEGRRLGRFQALVTEVAYLHWHRMLFARFLAENDLLMYEGMDTPVSLEECAELAPEIGELDGWAVAARFAGAMLPGVFRLGDPALQVRFAAEDRQTLEKLLASLHAPIFHADDSLGWVYQFWQAKAKAEVNASGRKIGGADIPAVTQLFTEHYMVQFLLHNSLGAWWAGKHPGETLPTDLDYLRRLDGGNAVSLRDGTPAAGTFPGWPATAKELRILDPSCGSGHFLVAAFALMVRFRMQEEGLSKREAGDAVLRENLFGLELDPRCTQIAAFALALTAWKHGGYRALPLPHVACSGIRLGGTADDWRKLAGKDGIMQAVLQQVRELFAQAPDLGSLIDPHTLGQTINRPRPAPLPTTGTSLQMGLLPGASSHLFEAANESGDDWAGQGKLSPLVAMERLLPKLEQAAERFGEDGDDAPIFGEAAKQAVRAVKLLAGKYHLVITNVPYLGRGNQDEALREFCAREYPRAKADLATVFVERCLQFCEPGGSTALVTPQNWLFLGSYTALRGYLLRQRTWNVVAKLGEGGFESSAAAGAFVGLFVLTNASPKTGFVPQSAVDPFMAHEEACRRLEELFDKIATRSPRTALSLRNGTLDEEKFRQLEAECNRYTEQNPKERDAIREIQNEYRITLAQTDAYRATHFAGLDASTPRTTHEKAELLETAPVQMVAQAAQRNNPDSRILLEEREATSLLSKYANCFAGLSGADIERFTRGFWELPQQGSDWEFLQNSFVDVGDYLGRSDIFLWQGGNGDYYNLVVEKLGVNGVGAWIRGGAAWGKQGVAIVKMRNLLTSIYSGGKYGANMYALVPNNPDHLEAIYCFTKDETFLELCRSLDQKLDIANQTILKVPFDLDRWQAVAAEKYPDGLPAPHSNDPTQWLFDGHPARAEGQPGDVLQVAVARLLGYRWPRQTGAEIPGCHLLPDDGLDAYADADGIVCLPSVAGEAPAAERLRVLLTASDPLTPSDLSRLLAEVGYSGKTLDEWLRDGFFAQHVKRFDNRPFLWQIWDGVKKGGFSAIVNYHRLDRAKLEKLTYTYLGDWINRQAADDRNGIAGANARLVAAQALQKKLEAILEGEPPFDIYVRWKPLAEQPLGWEPDLNDGVRLNIRPFMEAGILRAKPNINWNKDRGTNPDGTERHNDRHTTLAEKRTGRDD